jgi:NAD(P) transhydrogenase subunit beta
MNTHYILEIIYLIASVTFVIGLKMLSHPDSARKGNLVAAFGMVLAIIATIVFHEGEIHPMIYGLIGGSIAIGTVVGWLAAKKVQMTKMPELVSIFNGMGGACAAAISIIEFSHHTGDKLVTATIMAGLVIGTVSFSGSIIAFLKLNGTMNKPVRFPSYNIVNNLFIAGVLGLAAYMSIVGSDSRILMYSIFFLSILYGVMFVVPIGGADMPVVISLLNSFTGLAAAFGGFLYGNQVMLTGGILVGSAGTLLTIVMCKAMNRPLSNVIFGAFGGSSEAGIKGDSDKGSIKDISVTDTAVLMNYSKKVIIVPGYGLAVAQAQHVIHELESLLIERGVDVKYAIHPVAGRMPGHMNVLLAESNVDYSKLVEMEEVNPEFSTTDVVIVIGANDVVNPAAKTDPSSPIYGMPILDVENAQHIIVNKRSMNAGYAGIDNDLFYNTKTSMLFGDAKKVLTDLVSELKSMN